ncbi:MAG TPA: HAD hydrolase-like protein, partial [Candidatus Polarisedimenticolaceae bacterium]|nr:HAD hydrolase-like protein [Candidatus Polarisedimenticolaceae bacterium]
MSDAAATPPPLDPAAVRGVVFDLDGTLVDSYAAIAASVNHARAHFGLAELPAAVVRRTVGRGLEALLAELLGPQRVELGVRLFRERYAETFAAATIALPGAAQTLGELTRRGYVLAVASNKPARFSDPILAALGLRPYLRSVEGPDLAGA